MNNLFCQILLSTVCLFITAIAADNLVSGTGQPGEVHLNSPTAYYQYYPAQQQHSSADEDLQNIQNQLQFRFRDLTRSELINSVARNAAPPVDSLYQAGQTGRGYYSAQPVYDSVSLGPSYSANNLRYYGQVPYVNVGGYHIYKLGNTQNVRIINEDTAESNYRL